MFLFKCSTYTYQRKANTCAPKPLSASQSSPLLSASPPAATPPTPPKSESASSSAQETTTPEMMTARTGSFEGLNEQSVEGVATIEDHILTLSGFSSSEGPDLHVYLTNGTDEAAVTAGVSLGAVAFDD